jgi:hypothetical protein
MPPETPPKTGPKPSRPKSFPNTPTAGESGFPEHVPALPEGYLRDEFVLMTRDPALLFGYWEMTPGRVASKAAEKRSDEEYAEVFRLSWPARTLFDLNFALLPVAFSDRRAYLQAPFPGLVYRAEIGWLGSRGNFIPVLASNEIAAPPSGTDVAAPMGASESAA